jgi:Ala-tRNA(Pro) deacylase
VSETGAIHFLRLRAAAPRACAALSAPTRSPLARGMASTDAPAAPPAAEAEDPRTSERVLALLKGAGLTPATLTHAPTKTSEESAAVRGVPLATGAKAMLVKSSGARAGAPPPPPFALAILPANRRADLGAIKKLLGAKNMTLAAPEEVRALTGCIPGAVPPFGSLFGVPTLADAALRDVPGGALNFNAGLRTLSVLGLSVEDWIRIEAPRVESFSSEMPPPAAVTPTPTPTPTAEGAAAPPS